MDLLPPRIADFKLFALLTDILSVQNEADGARLRLQLMGHPATWQALVDLAQAQAVLIPFIWALARRALLLPSPRGGAASNPTVALTLIQQQHLARRQRQREQLTGALAALNRAGIEPLLLKGARYLLAAPGSWREGRDMRDLDLLIGRSDAERAMQLLAAEGYAAEPDPPPQEQHLPEMNHSGHPSVIELHTEALAPAGAAILPTDLVWYHATRLIWEGYGCHVLPDDWQLLHCLLNHQLSDRGHVRRSLAVAPLWEFAMLGRELPPAGWQAITGHMARMHRGEVLGSWIVQAGRLYGLASPPGVAISPQARAHADSTLQRSGTSLAVRRAGLLIDQLRTGFSADTLGARYRVGRERVGLAIRLRHVRFLLRRYRGRVLARLFGIGPNA